MRDRYELTETSCQHSYKTPDGRRVSVLYWVREGGGYVWYIDGRGQQTQPTHPTGETWRAVDGAAIRDLCKAARKRERQWRGE